MTKTVKIALVSILFLALIFVRSIAPKIVYDPFMEFFKNDYLLAAFPSVKMDKLFAYLFFRNLTNTLISLGIIYLFFQKRQLIIFSIKFYAITFVVLSIAYLLLLRTEFSSGYLLAFYIRRMLIHPIFLLILLPAFYYQQRSNQN